MNWLPGRCWRRACKWSRSTTRPCISIVHCRCCLAICCSASCWRCVCCGGFCAASPRPCWWPLPFRCRCCSRSVCWILAAVPLTLFHLPVWRSLSAWCWMPRLWCWKILCACVKRAVTGWRPPSREHNRYAVRWSHQRPPRWPSFCRWCSCRMRQGSCFPIWR